MAGVTMLQGSGGTAPKKSVSALKKPVVSLPTAMTKPPTEIEDFTLYIYGQQKIGKTSFTTGLSNCLHFMFEPSGKAFELYEVVPKTWQEFVAYIDLLEKQKDLGELTFKSFAIDTVDLAYDMCTDAVCGEIGVEHPNDANDFGKTWSKIASSFRKQMVRLANLGGFAALTHETEKEVETRSGAKYQSIVPSSQKKCNLILAKFCDLTGNYYIREDGQRVLRIMNSADVEAGNRIDTEETPRFRWKGTLEKIEEIPMGNSAKEAQVNFRKAFNNELEKPTQVESKKVKSAIVTGDSKPAVKKPMGIKLKSK